VATVLPKLAEDQCSSHRRCQTSSSTAAVCSCFETASQLRSDFSGRWAKTRRRASPGRSEMGSAITLLALDPATPATAVDDGVRRGENRRMQKEQNLRRVAVLRSLCSSVAKQGETGEQLRTHTFEETRARGFLKI